MNKNTKICAYCKSGFIPESNRQIYCKKDHWASCPVCGNLHKIKYKYEFKLGRGTACSPRCKEVIRKQSLLASKGTLSPGSTKSARLKARCTMNDKYGGYALQSEIISGNMKETLRMKYGVTNIKQVKEFSDKSYITRRNNWNKIILQEFPLNMQIKQANKGIKTINEEDMRAYLLKDKESIEFLSENGNQIVPKWGRVHRNIGLVYEDQIYQLLRFEKCKNEIILSDFGTKRGFINPNEYTLLMDTAINVMNIDSFTCKIPRSIATLTLTYSLSVELVERGMYQVFWVLEDERLKRLTIRDNIEEMKKEYKYVTSDYIDTYHYVRQQGRHLTSLEEIQTLS